MKKYFLLIFIFIVNNFLFAQQNTWVQKASPGSIGFDNSASFSIGSKIYVYTGYNASTLTNYFWEYDTLSNSWTQKANLPGTYRVGAVGFSIGSKGYIGTGSMNNDLWEYNPGSNVWTQKASMPTVGRSYGVGFSINGKGYIGTGQTQNSVFLSDFWEYSPLTDTWTQRPSIGSIGRQHAVAFSTGNKGYIGTGDYMTNGGQLSAIFNDFWEYSSITNTWIQRPNFPPSARTGGFGFSISGKGYIGGGYSNAGGGSFPLDLWEYDTLLNDWRQRANISTNRRNPIGVSTSTGGYMGTGSSYQSGNTIYLNDFFQYKPCVGMIVSNLNINICPNQSYSFNGQVLRTTGVYYDTLYASGGCDSLIVLNLTVRPNPVLSIVSNSSASICSGDSVQLNVQTTDVGLSYQWIKNSSNIAGETNNYYFAKNTGTYNVKATNAYTCSTTSNGISVVVNPLPTSTITPSGTIQKCVGSSITLNANSGTGLTYQWKLNGTDISGATNSSFTATQDGIYTVLVTNSNGCNNLSNSTIVVSNPIPTTPSVSASGSTTICQGNVVNLISSVTTGNQWYSNGILLAGATSSTLSVTSGGIYSVTNTVNGCSSLQSNNIQVIVNSIPTPTITPSGPTSFCQGGSVLLNSSSSTGNQWYINGSPISFANNSSYLVSSAGNYSVVTTDNGCVSSQSNPIIVNVIQPPAIPVINWNGTQFSTSITGVTYQWFLNGNVISGATSSVYTPTVIGTYQLQITLNGCTSSSDNFNLVVTGIDPTLILSPYTAQVFPNPASTDFAIKFGETPETTVELQLVNNLGALVKSVKTKSQLTTMKVSDLSSGVYYLKIIGGNYNQTKKVQIIKQK